MPYYALRQHDEILPDPRKIRRSGTFIPNRSEPCLPEFFYEAQISFIIVGLDDWVWTGYCFTETHFGSEESIDFYYGRGYDAPSGGAKPAHYPAWNPREYFLLILSLRVKQVTREWSNVVLALEERLHYHVAHSVSILNPSLK